MGLSLDVYINLCMYMYFSFPLIFPSRIGTFNLECSTIRVCPGTSHDRVETKNLLDHLLYLSDMLPDKMAAAAGSAHAQSLVAPVPRQPHGSQQSLLS